MSKLGFIGPRHRDDFSIHFFRPDVHGLVAVNDENATRSPMFRQCLQEFLSPLVPVVVSMDQDDIIRFVRMDRFGKRQ